MSVVLRAACLVAGLGIVAATWWSVLRTLVVPRGLSSWLTAVVKRGVRWVFTTIARRFDQLETRDAILVGQGPVTLLMLLLAWLMLFVAGFALILIGITGAGPGEAAREAGSSLFTLGFASTAGAVPTAVAFAAATTGLVVVALQIAYLPTLYDAFNRRERLVTLLSSRAGSPAWGPELLARHQLVAIVDNLPDFYADWELWAADVAESHTNYPVLIYFRSPNPLHSWVVGLLAVLDSAALYLALCPTRAPSEARLCLRMGFTSLRQICQSIGIPFDDDPRPDAPTALTYEEYLEGVARLTQLGFATERTPEDGWPHFRGWRVNYEPLCYELARLTDAVPALWSGPRTSARTSAPTSIGPIRPPDRQPDAPDRY